MALGSLSCCVSGLLVDFRKFVAVTAIAAMAGMSPAFADEAFETVWAGLDREEKALVDRLAADLSKASADAPKKGEKGAARFTSLPEGEKARYRAEALEQLGVLIRQVAPRSPTSREV